MWNKQLPDYKRNLTTKLLEVQYNDSRLELEKIIEFRTKGAVLRSKTTWYNEGERNTKYFLNLEKPHLRTGQLVKLK